MRKTPVDMWSNAQTRNRLYVIISMQQNDTRYVMGMHTIKYNRWCVLRKYKYTLDKDQWKDRDIKWVCTLTKQVVCYINNDNKMTLWIC